MRWYLVHTKPRQEACALQNLNQQGYDCYLPLMSSEKLLRGQVSKSSEHLFPR
jgi:transcriptional antiterminator RfaH